MTYGKSLPDWEAVGRRCAKKCKIGSKKTQIERQIEVLQHILTWKKRSKDRRISLSELSKKCNTPYKTLLKSVADARARLAKAEAQLEAFTKIEACTFSKASVLHRSMERAASIQLRTVQRARKPVRDAVRAEKRRFKRQNMVTPSEIHEVGQRALEQMAESQEECWQRRLENWVPGPKKTKKRRVSKK